MPGQYFDSETSLNYNYFRDYDPVTGRYVESDPIGLRGGINTYVYAGGTPTDTTDPKGDFGIVGALIGAGFELGVQAFKNYRDGCDLYDYRNYDWVDVGVSAAVGAFAPGFFRVGKTVARSGRAVVELESQRLRAQTLNRVLRLEQRIDKHNADIASAIATQAAFQLSKQVGKEIAASAQNNCGCRK